MTSFASAEPVKVFLLGGHSNIAGGGQVNDLTPEWNVPQDDVLIWLDHNVDGVGNWATMMPGHGGPTHSTRPGDPEGITPGSDGNFKIGPELSLGRTLADAYPDHRIAIIKQARSGTIAEWSTKNVGSANDPEHPWSSIMQKSSDALGALLAAGHTYEVAGFFFGLGARDARNWAIPGSTDPVEIEAGHQEALARSAMYGENLTNFIGGVRDEFGDDLPFVMSLMVPETTPELATAYPGFLDIRAGQLDVVANVPRVIGFETAGLTLEDAIHYDAPGQIEYGQRFANSYLQVVAVPEPSGGVLAGSVIISLAVRRRRRPALSHKKS
jgi:hypothetical protein